MQFHVFLATTQNTKMKNKRSTRSQSDHDFRSPKNISFSSQSPTAKWLAILKRVYLLLGHGKFIWKNHRKPRHNINRNIFFLNFNWTLNIPIVNIYIRNLKKKSICHPKNAITFLVSIHHPIYIVRFSNHNDCFNVTKWSFSIFFVSHCKEKKLSNIRIVALSNALHWVCATHQNS